MKSGGGELSILQRRGFENVVSYFVFVLRLWTTEFSSVMHGRRW